ncbi:MAG: nucleotidyltransferase [Butyrivibrio sp.]
MKTTGIIAEYNPFHTGHKYHIEETRKITGAECIVVIMSGDFVQRGTPALADKFTRAEAALIGGADIVIELPVMYSTGSAEIFASGAVSVLNGIGGIDCISFGGETDDINLLDKIADILCREPKEFKIILQKSLKEGNSMPMARRETLISLLPESSLVIDTPNNILGIEYLKALKSSQSRIKPCIIPRKGADYHSEELTRAFASATALRRCFNKEDFNNIKKYLPQSVYELYRENYGNTLPVYPDDMNSLMYYSLLSKTEQGEKYLDINESLKNKLINLLKSGAIPEYDEMIRSIKSRELTYTRISRGLLHMLLNITVEDLNRLKSAGYPAYARVLGFNKTGQQFLSSIRKTAGIPVIVNLSENMLSLSDLQKLIMKQDIFASDVYRNIVRTKFKTTLKDDFRSRPIIIP